MGSGNDDIQWDILDSWFVMDMDTGIKWRSCQHMEWISLWQRQSSWWMGWRCSNYEHTDAHWFMCSNVWRRWADVHVKGSDMQISPCDIYMLGMWATYVMVALLWCGVSRSPVATIYWGPTGIFPTIVHLLILPLAMELLRYVCFSGELHVFLTILVSFVLRRDVYASLLCCHLW